MASSGVPTIIKPPALVPPTSGLYSAAQDLTPDDMRWEGGFFFEKDGCTNSRVALVDPCASTTKEVGDATETITEYTPTIAYATLQCSGFGYQAIDWEARVRRRLEACESRALAHELWTGTVAQANGYANPYFNDTLLSDVVTAGATSVTAGLACLEQALHTAVCGQPGMIHATPQLVTYWQGEGLLEPHQSGLLKTALGTVVVADSGYDGSGPNGVPAAAGSQWAYATDTVYVMRGEIEVYGGPNPEGVSRADNVVTIYAERPVAAFWTGCALFAAEFNVPICGIGGSGS